MVHAKVAEELSEERSAAICSMLKQHHVEASMDFYNVLQQMVTLAPGLRLIYRTNFAGMYNDISQVVYFHNPKFARQPQLPTVKEIAATTINALPLMTELFPDIPVFYDDDPVIPALTKSAKKRSKTREGGEEEEEVPDTIEEFVRPFFTLDAASSSSESAQQQQQHNNHKDKSQFAWLICCGTVFLIDKIQNTVWASPDESLLPLVNLFLSEADFSMLDQDKRHNSSSSSKRRCVDMSSAHGHITLLH